MKTDVGLQAALGLLCGVNAMGILFTFLIPETKGKTLEELTDDKVVGKQLTSDNVIITKV